MSQQLKDEPIIIAPPPWTLKVDVYTAPFWISASQVQNFPFDIAYSPLELSSQFADLGAAVLSEDLAESKSLGTRKLRLARMMSSSSSPGNSNGPNKILMMSI